MVQPRSFIRIIHPTTDISRVRFNNNMLVVQERVRGKDFNSFDNSSQLGFIGI